MGSFVFSPEYPFSQSSIDSARGRISAVSPVLDHAVIHLLCILVSICSPPILLQNGKYANANLLCQDAHEAHDESFGSRQAQT